MTPSSELEVRLYLPSHWSHEMGEKLAKTFCGNTGLRTSSALEDGRVPAILFFNSAILAGAALELLGELGEQFGAAIYNASGYVVHISQLPGTWQEMELSHWLRSTLENDELPEVIHLQPLQRGRRQALLCFRALAFAQNASTS